jgi:hypothetical protein
VHYSFEKCDLVTCSTVSSTLRVSDRTLHRSELVSFSVEEAVVEAAHAHMSALEAAEAVEQRQLEHLEEEEVLATEAAAAAAAASTKAASISRFTELNARREEGKKRDEAKARKRRRAKVAEPEEEEVPIQGPSAKVRRRDHIL